MRKNATRLHGLAALLLALTMVLSLTACGGSAFDASGYVEASMKLLTTGDSEALEAFEGKAVVENAEDFDKEITEAMESMVGASETGDLPESLQTKFTDLVKSMMGGVNYSVGEATELTEGSADGYEVPLTIKPLQLNIQDDLNKWIEDFQANTDSEKLMNMDLNELYEQIYEEVADLLTKAIEKKEYGEEQTFNIPVTKNKDGLYEMDENALQEAITNAFATDVSDALS